MEETPAPYIWRPKDKLRGWGGSILSAFLWVPQGAVFYLLSHLAYPACVLRDDTEV